MSWIRRAPLVVGLLAAPAWASEPSADLADPSEDALAREVEAMREELAASRADVRALQAQVDQLTQEEQQPTERFAGAEIVVAEGEAASEAVAIWHDVHVHGRVTGDALSLGGDVVVHAGGEIDGDAVSIGGEVVVDEGGRILGDKVAITLGENRPLTSEGPAAHHAVGSLVMAPGADETMRWLYHRLVWMLTAAGAAIITMGLVPERVARVADDVGRRPVRSAIVGTVATGLLSMFALLFVALTVGVGSPVSLAIFAALGMAWLLGFVGFCQALGDRAPFASKAQGRWLALAGGVVVLAFVGSLPWVGWLALGTISMIGVGASLSTRFGAAKA